jgi:SAM-dependent methyltransferase
MDGSIIQQLRSPETGNVLELVVIESEGNDVVTGRLVDVETGFWFRMENGIADLAPLTLRNEARHGAFCAKYGLDPDSGVARQRGALAAADLDAYVSQIDFFRDYHKQYETDVVESPFYKIFDEATLGVWSRQELKAGDLVAEIGCGSGRQTLPMAQFGCKVIGVDLSEEMLLVARKKLLDAGQQANLIVASADRLPLTDGYADAAVIFGSLHHFPDPELSVAEAARLVKSGGRFFMVEPHDSLLRPVFELAMGMLPLWKEEAADEPLFSAKQWNNWFGRNGFKAKISYSTILPPHLFYLTGHAFGVWLLKASDGLVNLIPGIKRLCGVIVADAVKVGVAGSGSDTTSGACD